MTLADRVVVMNHGVIEQVGPPNELYHSPKTRFVAGFIGSPAMNFIPARLEEGKIRLPFGDAPIPAGVETDKRDVIAGIRPEHFEDAQYGDDVPDSLRFKTTVDVVESMGSELYAYFVIKGTQEVRSEQLDELAADAGMDDVPGGGTSHVVARLDARSRAEHGKEVEVVLDTSQIKLLDTDGGRSLTRK
jgi:multiple sugar transport system ATP-binding protein